MPIDRAANRSPDVLAALWRDAGLPAAALDHVDLPGAGPVVPSHFAVADAAQASLGAATLAAAEIRHRRGHGRQLARVDRAHVVAQSLGWFSLDGVVPPTWDPIAGLYPCADGGWVRIHANFAHHRDGALRLLGLPEGPATKRVAVADALRDWRAESFETAAAEAGLVVSAARTFAEWDTHPQAAAVAAQPLVRLERIGDAPAIAWLASAPHAQPLAGLRVLDLTRILAGPVGCRTLAAHGADVLMINSPHLPNIDAIAEVSRGKRSAHADLRTPAGRAALDALVADAHVFVQGYRPGGLAALGYSPEALARARPGIVAVSLSAYGTTGPWGGRRGFDSLVQTATGFNLAEAAAAGAAKPQAMPLQILDFAAGFLLAFGAQAALLRQADEGGSWRVDVSLARVAHWLRGLGPVDDGFAVERLAPDPWLVSEPSGFGRLVGVRHAGELADTPAVWRLPSMPPGSHPARWA